MFFKRISAFKRAIFSIIAFLRDLSSLTKIPKRKRNSNRPEIWDWRSERGVKKRYERAWVYISEEDRDNDEGWERVIVREVRKRTQYVFPLSHFTESWVVQSASDILYHRDQFRDIFLVRIVLFDYNTANLHRKDNVL